MDLKQGLEMLRTNKTFRAILSTLLSIGIFLNGVEASKLFVVIQVYMSNSKFMAESSLFYR